MTLNFTKYQGTGNDFIMIDERDLGDMDLSVAQISGLCDRRFGVGADGLIIIKSDSKSDFYVDYYNADGSQSFCGNGARCSVKFAREIGMIDSNCSFYAIDGLHEAEILANEDVKLLMSPVNQIFEEEGSCFITDTGSPHYVQFVPDLSETDIVDFGRKIRFGSRFSQNGINVNLAQLDENQILVKTYERGVEDETLSCGTGVTAVALAYAVHKNANQGITQILTKGGTLKVHWTKTDLGFDQIYLEGPAVKVYGGQVEL